MRKGDVLYIVVNDKDLAVAKVREFFSTPRRPSDREWQYDGSTVWDGYDPDGNVFQLFT